MASHRSILILTAMMALGQLISSFTIQPNSYLNGRIHLKRSAKSERSCGFFEHKLKMSAGHDQYNDQIEKNTQHHRRNFLKSVLASTISVATVMSFDKNVASAEVAGTPVEMRTFIDPKGLFSLNVPKRFFAIRRTVKGDLPDEETGQGRRGSSIFTAGDMAKAEVVAVERFPTAVLLQEEGIKPTGDLSTFTSIGDPIAIANLITLRRDRDKQGQSKAILIPDSVSTSSDGKTLTFQLSTQIDVQKPELLMEQMGVSELVRITLAKATLTSNDGQMMAVFASALKQDFDGTSDGDALRESVESFVSLDQSVAVK